jgi:ribosomal protein L21E
MRAYAPWTCIATVLTACSFSRDFKKRGMIPMSTYLKQYKVGDIVDVVANGTEHS